MAPPTLDELRDEAYRRYQAGDAATAAQLCRQLLQQQPRCAEAVYLLGVLAQDAGQWGPAFDFYRQAAALAPNNPVFASTLGEAHLTLGRPVEALACFRRAVALRPTYDRAHNNLGRVLHAQGDVAAARAAFEEAIRLNPRYAVAHNNLGALLLGQGQLAAAAGYLNQALALRPNYPEAHYNLGATFLAQGDYVVAAERFREAIRLRPGYARAHLNLGRALEQQTLWADALASYENAARLQPEDAETLRFLGDLLILKRDWPAALAALERATALGPGLPEPFARLAGARQQVCDWRNYTADVDRLWADAEKQFTAGEATAVVPFHALAMPWPRQRLLAIARSHCRQLTRQQNRAGQSLPFHHQRTRSGRLRVGYLSGDFYDHPVGHLLQGLFGRHDRERFEVFAYSFGHADDSVYRKRIAETTEHFVDVSSLSLPDLARRIAADGVHVLVDLMGHTGVNRLGALAVRPAPIQVNFLGMLGTTGAEFIDYLITDRTVTPPEFAADFTEKFVTLPHCYLVAEPLGADLSPAGPESKQELRRTHGLPESAFVFCCFNSSYKIEPRGFGAWMRILTAVPEGALWLYSAGPEFEANLRREAAAHGVDAGRLVFAPFVPRPEHLRRHRAADLFLDTLVYNAAATASLALQAGLPVLTCLGDTFASRVGASLLNAVGLPELVAPNLAEYEQKAIELARQPELLFRVRERLAAKLPGAPPFDTARFVCNLERAYQAMWDIYTAGGSPRAIEVSDTQGSPGGQ
jgi:predicted O-linked N-acetylglucosamine transferase (SPINDLY family)